MIITRTPFRVSFFGGGTDFPAWFKKKSQGHVISCAIDKFSYISTRFLPPFFDYKYRIRYFEKEEVKSIAKIKHPVVKFLLKYLNYQKKGLEIVHGSDLPALSGLGSSSAFTVGLLQSLNGLKNIYLTKKKLSTEAIKVEQDFLKENVGCQDQVITSYGGLNSITFQKKIIDIKKINVTEEYIKNLEKSLLLVFTDLQRNSNEISKEQIIRTNHDMNDDYLYKILNVTKYALNQIFNQKKFDIKNFGEALNQQWSLKKQLSVQISNKKIDEIYNYGIKNGAVGGKLLGAGSGGFVLFAVEEKNKKNFLKKLKNFTIIPVRIDHFGSKIIYKA